LPPLSHKSSRVNKDIEEEEEPDEEEYKDEMEGEEEEQEEVNLDDEEAVTLQDIENMLAIDESEVTKDEMAEARKQHYITKNSYIHKKLLEIKTGENAISFFAKYGNNTPIKFVNCLRADFGPLYFRPFDLRVIHDEKELNQQN
jgi:dynein heavy chain, axonemal